MSSNTLENDEKTVPADTSNIATATRTGCNLADAPFSLNAEGIANVLTKRVLSAHRAAAIGIHGRFTAAVPCLALGASAAALTRWCNVYTSMTSDSSAATFPSIQEYNNFTADCRETLHFASVANDAFFHAQATQAPQTILVRGAEASAVQDVIFAQLQNLSRISRKGRIIERKLRAAQSIIKACISSSSSSAGIAVLDQGSTANALMTLELELKCPGLGRPASICGGQVHLLAFESPIPTDSLSGSLPTIFKLAAKLGIPLPASANLMMSTTSSTTSTQNEVAVVDMLLDSFRILQIPYAGFLKFICAILQLRSISFADVDSNTVIQDKAPLLAAAEMLGVFPDDLEACLASKMNIRGLEAYTELLTASGAAENLKEVTNGMYVLAVNWLVERINCCISYVRAQKFNLPEDEIQQQLAGTPGAQCTPLFLINVPPLRVNVDSVFALTTNYFHEAMVKIEREFLLKVPSQKAFETMGPMHLTMLSTLPRGLLGILSDLSESSFTGSTVVTRFAQMHEKNNEFFTLADAQSIMITHRGSQLCVYDCNAWSGQNQVIFPQSLANILIEQAAFVSSKHSIKEEINSDGPNTPVSAARSIGEYWCKLCGVPLPNVKAKRRSSRLSSFGTSMLSPNASDNGQLRPVMLFQKRFDALNARLVDEKNVSRVVYALAHSSNSTSVEPDPRFIEDQVRALGFVNVTDAIRQNAKHDIMVTYSALNFEANYKLVFDSIAQTKTTSNDSEATAIQKITDNLSALGLAKGYDFHVVNDNIQVAFRPWQFIELKAMREKRHHYVDLQSSDEALIDDDDFDSQGFHEMLEEEDDQVEDLPAASKQAISQPANSRSRQSSNKSELSDGTSTVIPIDLSDDKLDEAGKDKENEKTKKDDKKKKSKKDGKKKGETAAQVEAEDQEPVTSARRWWLRLVWLFTFMLPNVFIRKVCKTTRPDIVIAWREKVAICVCIFWTCAAQLYIIIGLGKTICPDQKVYTLEEVLYKTSQSEPIVAIYGNVYKLMDFVQLGTLHDIRMLGPLGGHDLTSGFPRVPSHYCNFAPASFPALYTGSTITAEGSVVQSNHQTLYMNSTNASYTGERIMDAALKKYVYYRVGWGPTDIDKLTSMANLTQSSSLNLNNVIFVYNASVYNLKPYMDTISTLLLQDFFPSGFVSYIRANNGNDMTSDNTFLSYWNGNKALQDCLNSIAYIGVIDIRQTPRCLVSNYVLLGFSCLLFAVIFVKFLAALQLGGKKNPEDHDRYVVLQMPCYTEDESSLRKAINSMTALNYDDKRKLMFIICDGNIIGRGNDRPTPKIVLDILGVDERTQAAAEAISFQSLGHGSLQHNKGKVYSGLYEHEGHVVPYLVVVKVGLETETQRPGNRGKRDSQMIMMRFFNRVYMDKEMSPLELAMCHHMRNVIGVDPLTYEFCLMIDADTDVERNSLTQLVSAMISDTRVMGCCGETRLANEKHSWATMIQVYEYYISHFMAKAFESLFGSVTCLPGCFCMYRLRHPAKNTPLLVSNMLVEEYGVSKVETLHQKNLLHLGEDRYLTTLMLKNFPDMRTIFCAEGKCQTVAPENWNVLLSQRRRWINSTVHNLVELLNIAQLCGFCLFSMRFVVFIDLLATFVQPAIVVYLGYLIYLIVTYWNDQTNANFPLISLILLAAIYGAQAIIFMIKREWQHVGWMLIYILSIPIFSFFIPVYSFWHMDDFSWGNTRVVVGESGKQVVILPTQEKFDSSVIPLQRWADYEREMKRRSDSSVLASARIGLTSARPRSSGGLLTPAPAAATLALNTPNPYDTAKSPAFESGRGFPPPIDTKKRASMQIPSSALGVSPGMSERSYNSYTKRGSDGARPGTLIEMQQRAAEARRGLRTSYVQPVQAAPREPSDAELYAEVRRLLSGPNVDLTAITKRQVRDALASSFGVDLEHRRAAIDRMIRRALAQLE